MREFLLFMLGWATRSALAISCAYIVCSTFPRASAAAKNMIWRCALVAVVAIPVGMIITARIGFNIPTKTVFEPAVSVHQKSGVNMTRTIGTPVTIPSVLSSKGSAAIVRVNDDGEIPMDFWSRVAILYSIGAAVVLGRWMLSLILVRRLSKSGSPLDSSPNIKVINGTLLRVPATFGWRKPVILIPKEVTGRSPERLNAIILHEKAHLRRSDWLWQALATLTTALQWANPAIWFLSANLLSSAEESADNDVLTAGVPASVYASELLSFASANTPNASASMGLTSKSRIRTRLDHILDPHRSRNRVAFRSGTSAALGFLILCAGLCSVGPNQLLRKSGTDVEPLPIPSGVNDADEFAPGGRPTIVFVGDGESYKLPTWGMDGVLQGTGLPEKIGVKYACGVQEGKRAIAVGFRLPKLKRELDLDGPHLPRIVAKLGGVLAHGYAYSTYPGDPIPIGHPRVIPRRGNETGNIWTLEGESGFLVPAGWHNADLEIGKAAGDYQKVGEWTDGSGDFEVALTRERNKQTFVTRREGYHGKMVSATTLTGETPATMVELSVPPSAMMRSWRLTAFDRDDRPIKIEMSKEGPDANKPGFGTSIGTADATPEGIHRLILEERDYKWIKVKNIPLAPRQGIKP